MSKYYAKDPTTEQFASIVCHQHKHPDFRQWYTVTVGETTVGQVIHAGRDGWVAISYAQTTLRGLRKVEGFRTRWQAIVYLLRAYGIWND